MLFYVLVPCLRLAPAQYCSAKVEQKMPEVLAVMHQTAGRPQVLPMYFRSQQYARPAQVMRNSVVIFMPWSYAAELMCRHRKPTPRRLCWRALRRIASCRRCARARAAPTQSRPSLQTTAATLCVTVRHAPCNTSSAGSKL